MTLALLAFVSTALAPELCALVIFAVVVSQKAAAVRERDRRNRERNRERWRVDVVAFFAEALGVALTEKQAAIARDYAEHGRVSVRSGHRVGKSMLIAGLALWVVVTHDDAIAILTSGNAGQVKITLWRELRRLHRSAKVPLGGALHLDPATGLIYDDGRGVYGLTASEPERFAGFAAAGGVHLFVDEASGFDDALIEAVLSNAAGGGGVLLAGNPTRPIGFFARTHREAIEGWCLHHIASTESPNVIAGRIVVRGLCTLEYVQAMAADFGAGSAAYAVRVLGEFPNEGADVVVGLAMLEAALGRYTDIGPAASADSRLEIGVDPARFGDDETVIQGRRGYRALTSAVHRKLDNVEVAARALEYVKAHRRPGEKVVVRVDVGGLGAGVVDHLTRAAEQHRIKVTAVNSASRSRHPERFTNVRAELAWCVRCWLKRGGALPTDRRRDAELLALRYSHDNALRLRVISKDDLRKVLRRSPDRADALALACWGESPLEREEGRDRTVRPFRIRWLTWQDQ